MKTVTKELLHRLEVVDWFCNAGKPAQVHAEVQLLQEWSQAVEVCASQASEDAGLEASNELTAQLAAHHREADKLWNSKIEEVKPLVVRLIQSKLAVPGVALMIPSERRKTLLDAIQWDLLGLCMAYEYQDLVPISRYYELLEYWYLAGHFPCGWIGEVPDEMKDAFQMGKLAVL